MSDTMQITQIEWITKTKARIYLDEEAAFILKAADIKAYDLKEGHALSLEAYTDLYENVLLKQARLKALNLLKMRDYSEFELHAKIQREFSSAALADSAVDYVKSYHYIDDMRYARNYVTYHAAGDSRRILIQKLRSKGISDDMINTVLDENPADEKQQILDIITKKFGDYSQATPQKRQKILNFLLRKGYSYSDIRTVIKDFDTNE
ncbi:MAG: recombination regulator RecX [Clostridiales bacterium]|nr:recombination regulator RecX [Clostridiales bacterium]MDY3746890.1 regulatory protein RecX [Lachnospiraceae bacterium]